MSGLEDAERFLRAEDYRRATKALERSRSRALVRQDAGELERIVELAQTLVTRAPTGRNKRLLYAATQNLRYVRRARAVSDVGAPPRPARTAFEDQLQAVDVAAGALEQQIRQAIALARAAAAPVAPAPAPAAAPAAPAPPPTTWEPRPTAVPRPRPATPPKPPKPPRPPRPPREIDWSSLLGARGLAWAGGLVTVLGIVFFFVLAANRGWLTHEIRIGLGGFTSIAVFCAGLWLKRRFGRLYSALAAVSAGIAGAYATLLAATALYGFVPQLWALVAAAAIAAVGVAVSLAWSAQTVAGLGLIGAMLVPLMILVDEGELSFVGTSFVAIVFAATAIVAQQKRWRELLLAAGGASLPQIAVLIAENGPAWRFVALGAVFWLLYLAVGIVWQLRFGVRGLEPVAGTLVIAGGAVATYGCAYLLSGKELGVHREGLGLLVVSAVYAALAVVFFRRPRARELTSLLWAVAAVLGAVAAGELFTGPSLTAVWGAVAVLLAWLAVRTGEQRLFLPAFGYLVLAVGYVFALEAPPDDLFRASAHPASGTPSVVAAAAALLLSAWYARRPVSAGEKARGGFFRELDAAVGWIRRAAPAYVWLAGLLSLYAASLALLELFVRVASFAWGHVGLAGLWAAVAFALVELGLRRPRLELQLGAFALLAFAVGEALAFDLAELPRTVWACSFLAVAAGALLLGFEFGRLAALRERVLAGGTAIVVSCALAAAALVALAHGDWYRISAEGGALLVLALLYAAFAVPVFRAERDLATLLWALALALALAGGAELLSGRWLVLAGASLCAALALLARRTREPRLQAGAALVFALALAYALWVEAPPRELFLAVAHPGAGVPALLFLAAAAGVFAYGPELRRHGRALSLGTIGILLFYAVSLSILELAELATDADVDTKFQRGHTGVSAFWGLISLGFLYLGLTRRSRALRLAGFGLFGVTLAKIFLYDLPFLSSLTRALSFIAVGTVLLFAGFFYQRLSEQLEERDRTAPQS